MIVRGTTAQKTGKVLIINSDPEITRILEVNLAHANLEVVSAQSGAEALQRIYNDKSDIIILDPALPDMEYDEIRRQIKESPDNSDIPIILISAKSKIKNRATKAEDMAVLTIVKPFDPKEVVALVQGYLMHKERTVNIDPLTGLPNRFQVNKEIARLIEEKATFAVIYIAMHDFKAVNRAYGYAQGDRVIQLLSDILSEAVRLFGNPEDLVGHFSGDKFVVVSTPWKARTLCRRIIADYNRRIKALFTEEHLQTGHAALNSPSASQEQTPIMSIHIAVVTNQKRTFRHHLEVTGYASEQIEYLKSSAESNCYFDLKINGVEPSLTVARRDAVQANKEEFRVVQGVLAWLEFFNGELGIPINKMKDSLRSLESIKAENLSQEQRNDLKSLQENYSHLTRVMEGAADLTRPEGLRAGTLFDEVDIRNTLNWVLEQVQPLAEQKEIKADIKVAGDIGRILIDKRSLTQSLLYIVRNEIRSSPPESHLQIRLAEKNEEYIYIEITNPDHFFSPRALNALLHGQADTARPETFKNELYPASVLVRGLGGKLEITSEKGTGTTYQVTIPKKWQSWMIEVNTLQMAMDISRKEARDAIKNIQRLVASIVEPVPPALKDAYDRLGGKVQELAVLCNRSLFLADDFNSRLEIQQDRLLQQESEQLATSEAIMTICRDMIRSTQVKLLFDLESGKRVVKYTLAVAKELKIPDVERQALYHAALLKDIALAFSRPDIIEQMTLTSREMVAAMKERLNLVWKALATIPFFLPACNLLLYRFERFDGTGGSFGIKGTDIPLGSRILAVADAFDFMTSARSPQGKISPKLAVQKIVAESGLCFDPHVVSALLMLWKRNELDTSLSESRWGIKQVLT
jgi:diguanylate cyclase (GGDEF)-like protein